MRNRPLFHLFVPKLLDPLSAWYQDFLFEAGAIHLSTLFSRYTEIDSAPSNSINSAFFQTINQTNQELPIAFYRSQVQTEHSFSKSICADPVYLEVGMSDVSLTERIIDLSDDEAKELIEMLNKHFEQDDLEFIFGSNQCWYLLLPEKETVQSYDLESVQLQNIVDKRVTSKQRNWQVIENEVQMLLHNSDVNKQREIAGLKPVNSLWFWGAGIPQEPKFEIERIFSNNNTTSILRAKIFAKAANCEAQVLPENINSLLIQVKNKSASHILLLDQLFMPAIENNLDKYQQELSHLDNQLIKPLLNAWQKNEIDIVVDSCDGHILKPIHVPFWRFWSQPKKLRELVS